MFVERPLLLTIMPDYVVLTIHCACRCTRVYLKQGHVLAVILLALFCGSITAVDEGAALLGVTVTWKKHKDKDTHFNFGPQRASQRRAK